MESVKQFRQQLFKKENMAHNILIALFVIFLVMGQPLPHALSILINTPLGTIVVIGVALSLFAYSNNILAILGLFVAFEMIRRSGSFAMDLLRTNEQKKWAPLEEVNKIHYSLEQEVVQNMAPIIQSDMIPSMSSFQPNLIDNHNAAPVSESIFSKLL